MGSFSKNANWCDNYLFICRTLTCYSNNNLIENKANIALKKRIGQIAISIAKNIKAYELKDAVFEDAFEFLLRNSKELANYALNSNNFVLRMQGLLLSISPRLFISSYGFLLKVKSLIPPMR